MSLDDAVSSAANAGLVTRRDERIALVDIGSNSIRLVVYDGLKRSPEVLFNEKVLCGLGRSLRSTGRLHPEGVEQALRNLVRFSRLARAMGVEERVLLATAAVREAEDADDFVRQVEELTGDPVTVISGKEEARLSGLGVVAGTPAANGIMGDLGGGSLELVELRDGKIGKSTTLGLGTLKLMDMSDGGPNDKKVQAQIAQALDQIDWLGDAEGLSFYPVGGTWRNLARLSLAQQAHPMGVVHGYRLTALEAMAITQILALQQSESLRRVKDLSTLRLKAVPYGAALLMELLRRSRCGDVIFSACGLREGYVFDRLEREDQLKDPLLKMAAQMGRREARFGDMGEALFDWTGELFVGETTEPRPSASKRPVISRTSCGARPLTIRLVKPSTASWNTPSWGWITLGASSWPIHCFVATAAIFAPMPSGTAPPCCPRRDSIKPRCWEAACVWRTASRVLSRIC